MNIDIIESKKFYNSRMQYRADVEGFTLLRLTCGLSGAAIKTATVGDDWGMPVYPDQCALISAMKVALTKIYGSNSNFEITEDGNFRPFGETTRRGSKESCINFVTILAKDMGNTLNLDVGNEMRNLYNDICHTDGEPMYLSDGVYLNSDGELFEP